MFSKVKKEKEAIFDHLEISFSSIQVSFFVHATEDASWLCDAVCAQLGISREELEIQKLSGHFGNEVFSVRAHLTGKKANEISRNIFERMDYSSRKKAAAELSKSVDEHDALYLRFDRQSLEMGLSLSDNEPIHVKLKPANRRDRESILRAYSELLLRQ